MRIKQLLFLATLLCLLVSCAPSEEDQVEITPVPEEAAPLTVEVDSQQPLSPFTLAIYSEHTLDPAHTDYRANLTLSGLLYEGLFQLNESFEAQPLLCQSYSTSSDGLIWNFTIREGVTFSDGIPLTADLVASSLTSSAQSDSRYASRLSGISHIGTSDNVLILTLSSPNNGLPALLDVPITLQDETRPLVPLGTGRYTLNDDQTALIPTEHYWQTAAQPLAQIPLHTIRQTDDLVSAFDAGYVSLVDIDLMGTQAPYFSSSYQTWDYPTSSLLYLAFNNREARDNSSGVVSPCASVQLRHIVSLAVDRSSIVAQDFAQHAVASTLPIHPTSPLYDALLAATGNYSPAALTAAVEELAPLDTPLRLITSNENASRLSIAQRIVTQLNDAGVYAELVSLPWDDYLLALEQGDFDIYLAESQLTADFDVTPLIGTEGALNYGGYTSASTDELLASARSAPSTSQSTSATRLYTHILEEVPIVPICFKNGSVLAQWGRVSQLTPTQSNTFYQLECWTFPDL